MEKKFTNIPEVIDPGITIPIFEEDVDAMSLEQPQKLGSYRARAGKFSNTLSNLLPSISAKLHHSKKQGKGAGADPNASTPDSSESAIGNLSAKSSQMFMMNTDQGMPSMARRWQQIWALPDQHMWRDSPPEAPHRTTLLRLETPTNSSTSRSTRST